MTFEYYDDLVNPTLKLSSTSMGGFFDAMKSYIVYATNSEFAWGKRVWCWLLLR